MIVGMGIDIAEVNRIQSVIESQKERFLRRVYTPDEAAYCEQFKNKYERYAACAGSIWKLCGNAAAGPRWH
jgi:holo-[acyl-carrier protein] synthase